jgi:uncharacterized protein YlzI (FlbEa/FlbD family)
VKFLKVTLANGDTAMLNMAFVKGMVEADGGQRTVINMADGKTATVRESIVVLLERLGKR